MNGHTVTGWIMGCSMSVEWMTRIQELFRVNVRAGTGNLSSALCTNSLLVDIVFSILTPSVV